MKDNQNAPNLNGYEELKRHNGSKSFEAVKLAESDRTVIEILLNIETSIIYSISHNIVLEDKDLLYYRDKISRFGERETFSEGLETLKDGTIWYNEYYLNWIINGDTTRHPYLDPLKSYENKNAKDWLLKFQELYNQASYIHVYMSDYYFKINDKWYLVEAFKKAKELGLNKDEHISVKFPAKEDYDVRMIKMKDFCPDFILEPEKRDTSLMKEVFYKSEHFEKVDYGITSYGYSAGWWYLDIKMPGMETIKIKRFASYKGPAMQLYRVPEEYGGRKDVLFVIQEPNDMHQEQVGGMYVIRPREIK